MPSGGTGGFRPYKVNPIAAAVPSEPKVPKEDAVPEVIPQTYVPPILVVLHATCNTDEYSR